MSTPAQFTEAHRAITESVCELLDSEEMVGPSPAERAAQLIADSEARATAELKKLADHWCDMHTVCAKERDQLRAEMRAVLKIVNEQTARAESAEAELAATKSTLDEEVNCAEKAEHEVVRQYARAERAEREVADLKANNRFHRGHSAGYAEAKADCESELATERARLDWLLSRMGGNVLPVNGCVAWTVDVYHYKNQFPSRAAIDAAIKEGA